MPLDITSIGAGSATSAAARVGKAAASPATAFTDALDSMVDHVEQTQADANGAVVNMLDGTGEVHDAMIALQRAEMTLQFTIQVRNKLLQAYQDVMRMPI